MAYCPTKTMARPASLLPALTPFRFPLFTPPELWQVGYQHLAQVCLTTSLIHLSPTVVRMGTGSCQRPAAPKHLTPMLTLWATAALAGMQDPGEREREGTQRT